MLKIYKASAGSGKTFQLVVEYLKLILKNPLNYRHILAVTFTNKATAEMKTRILEQLNMLASGHESNYISILEKETKFDETQIRSRAKQVLKNILHDYNRFSVSTIDTFTQRVIKAFNREMGISPDYQLELDNEVLLAEATDRLLANIGNDKNLLAWLQDFSREKIEDNQSQRIEENIKKLGHELFKEKFQVFFPTENNSVYSRENLDEFIKELNSKKTVIENTLKKLGGKAVALMAENGFATEDFSYTTTGIAGYLTAISNGVFKEPGKRVLDAETEPEKWYQKKHPQAAKIHRLVEDQLQPVLIEALEYYRKNEKSYFTTLAVLKQIRMLGILTDLKEQVSELLHEKGVLQISDSNLLLSKIIGQSDSPFIYEKTGSNFSHFMLDEFQDTSGLQWNNFRPLLANSLSEGNENLIVGDVKQSVYRWRNSNWKILAEQVYSDFNAEQIDENILEKNWRSDLNILTFNNQFFSELQNTFGEQQFRQFADEKEEIVARFRRIYDSLEQKPGQENPVPTGLVDIRFLPEENFTEVSAEFLVKQVKKLQDNGIKAAEIAILIRKNKEGVPIIQRFMESAQLPENSKYNLSVLSNESLFLYSSQAVLFAVNVIEYLVNPDNLLAKASLANQYNKWLLPRLHPETYNETDVVEGVFFAEKTGDIFETELKQKLENLKEKTGVSALDESIVYICSEFRLFELETEIPFIQTLIDKTSELKTRQTNDLSGFLFWWYESGNSVSVSTNEEIDSIRLLTVHKSKGLEYKAILIPYFDWKVSEPGKAPILWCTPKTEPYNRFPLLPVKSGSALLKTDFREEYIEESASLLIDIFNLVYVAFTRAKSVLIIHSPEYKEPKNSTSAKPMQSVLKLTLEKMADQKTWSHCFSEEKESFVFGALSNQTRELKNGQTETLKKYSFTDFSTRIKIKKSDAEDLLIAGENKISVKNKGKIIHEILASVSSADSIDIACQRAFLDGKITETEKEEIQQQLKESFTNPLIESWFSEKFSLLNERNLLTPEHIYRPDRIMYSGQSAIVVDYKTGHLKEEKYNRQVLRYARTLKETGFLEVEGYIWYLQLNEVIKVC